MLLLKTAPQDIPYSLRTMNRILVIYLLTGLVVQGALVAPAVSIGRMILGLVVAMVFTYVVLASLELKARFVQTMSALVGVGIYFNLLAWPLIMQLGKEDIPDSTAGMLSFLTLFLLSWELVITAHIYRHALNTKMGHAIILSVALFLLSLTMSQMIFPGMVS